MNIRLQIIKQMVGNWVWVGQINCALNILYFDMDFWALRISEVTGIGIGIVR